ncbi:MAG: hypothetical protein WA101_01250 [Minisyncoccia bacterium]
MENLKIENEKKISLDNKKFKELVEYRNIKAEDFKLIKEIASFSIDLIIRDFHNFFSSYQERSGKELESLIRNEKDEKRKLLYEKFLEFYKKYDYLVCWNLVVFLEN